MPALDIHTVVINLDRDTDRLAHMTRELGKVGIAFERFPALSGAHLPDNLHVYFDSHALLTPGQIGCYASHLRICERIASGEWPSPTLVLEDDLGISPNLPDILSALIEAMPASWDMVRLANKAKHAVLDVSPLPHGHTLVRYSRIPTSTGASLVSKSGAEKFLRKDARALPIDQDLRRAWAWNLDVFGIEAPPVERDVFKSSSIDAVAPGHRRNRARIRAIRLKRSQDNASRLGFALKEVGLSALLELEFANMLRALTPRALRGDVHHVAAR